MNRYDFDEQLDRAIDALNREASPAPYEQGDPEMFGLVDTARLVKGLREPADADPDFAEMAVSRIVADLDRPQSVNTGGNIPPESLPSVHAIPHAEAIADDRPRGIAGWLRDMSQLAAVLLVGFIVLAGVVFYQTVWSGGDGGDPAAGPGIEVAGTATPDIVTTPGTHAVDMAPLDAPDLEATVYWLGYRFDPGSDLPPLELESVAGPAPPGGGPSDSHGELQYRIADADTPMTGVTLRLWKRSDWDKWVDRDPATDDYATVFHMFWDSPCAEREDMNLENGEAVIYSSYQALADPAVTDCPTGAFDRFLAHVFFGETVVTINAPFRFESASGNPYPAPYNSKVGLTAIVQALQPRGAVAEQAPLPTPVADLADPGSLVLQEADLPGRYSYGDDGCAPGHECFTGPTHLASEGRYDALSAAAGEILSFSYQFEHVGFSAEGTPDPAAEPPTIYSQALICVSSCDPAAILELGSDLLSYSGYPEAEEIETPIDLGDEARVYEVNSLVLGQVEPGTAVVWRHGPVVSLVAVGGLTGDPGQHIAIGLARAQGARVERALFE